MPWMYLLDRGRSKKKILNLFCLDCLDSAFEKRFSRGLRVRSIMIRKYILSHEIIQRLAEPANRLQPNDRDLHPARISTAGVNYQDWSDESSTLGSTTSVPCILKAEQVVSPPTMAVIPKVCSCCYRCLQKCTGTLAPPSIPRGAW